MLDITFNNLNTNRKFGKDFFVKILKTAVAKNNLDSKNIELSINLVEESKIKALNKKYRNKNKVTDVLSFPLHDKVTTKSTEGGILSLGDIFICFPVAKKYATREGVSLNFKLAFLTVHGFLHLLGYDHEKSLISEKEMFKLQDEILKSFLVS